MDDTLHICAPPTQNGFPPIQRLPMQLMRRALIPTRVLEQVQLVIIFSVPPRAGWDDLRDDLLSLGREVLCLDFFRHALGGGGLFRRVCEDF